MAALNGVKGDNTMMKFMNTNSQGRLLRRILSALAVLALLVGIVLPGLGEEAEKTAEAPVLPDYFRGWTEVPELAGRLAPLNLSCESEGIRMEVTAGAIAENKALFIITLQDLEGGRLAFNSSETFDTDSMVFSGLEYQMIRYDEEERKKTYLFSIEYNSPEGIITDSAVPLRLACVELRKQETLDIQDMFAEYGSSAAFVDVPELRDLFIKNDDPDNPEFYTAQDYTDMGIRALDYTHPLSVRLHDRVELSGIGVDNGMLHVQLHYVNNDYELLAGNIYHVPVGAYVRFLRNGTIVFPNDGTPDWMAWKAGGEEFEDYFTPWDPEKTDIPKIEVTFTETGDVITGDWEVRVPLEPVWLMDTPYTSPYTDTFFSKNLKYELTANESARIVASDDYRNWKKLVIPAELDGHPVTSIGDSAFDSCTGLASIVLPDTLKSIGNKAFRFCWNLTTISLPDGLISIGGGAFDYTGLTFVSIPDSVVSIGENAFHNTPDMNRAVPTLIVSEGSVAMQYCRNNLLPYSLADGNGEIVEPVLPDIAILNEHPDYTDMLMRYYPSYLKDMVPLSLSCEKNGLRLEVLAGSAREQGAMFVCRLLDPEDFRVDPNNALNIWCSFPGDISMGFSAIMYLDYDTPVPASSFAFAVLFDGPVSAAFPDDAQATLHLPAADPAGGSGISTLDVTDSWEVQIPLKTVWSGSTAGKIPE